MTRNELKRFKALEEELLSTKEKLEEAIKGKDSWYKDYKEVKKTLDSIHGALDALPDAPPRKISKDCTSYNEVELSVESRLFAWIANVAFGEKSPSRSVKED
ncbi:MAG: hypothetical protein WC097_01605 [Eubacteriales bacterium]